MRGLLPDHDYDIHCPMMGGAAGRPNYLRSSCHSRQRANGCSRSRCDHRLLVRNDPPKEAPAPAPDRAEADAGVRRQPRRGQKEQRYVSRLRANKLRLAASKGLPLDGIL